ncbi:MAG: aldehyde dehydrogenase family protein [Verrucomicrobiales bacterium]
MPRDALQCVNCGDGETGKRLIADDRTAAVVLTGAWETALLFRSWRPDLRLFAETSGKNAIVVSALADRELAARDLVRSAFGHAGQKCSAASLGILEAEVYDDPVFRRQLCDAAASLACGPAEDPRSVVTPLIREPGEALRRALATLEPGESWLLEPRQDPGDPCGWSPGIKLGVRPGSWFHQTECFRPVLGLIRARDLGEAVRIQNDVPFGLTAGFHSLDESEIDAWRERVEAGNAYINRGITGAIVRRQPFGGWKRSSVEAGAKAVATTTSISSAGCATPRRAPPRRRPPTTRRRGASISRRSTIRPACLREQRLPLSPPPRRRPPPSPAGRICRARRLRREALRNAARAKHRRRRAGGRADRQAAGPRAARLCPPDLGGDPEPPLLAAAAQLGMNWIDDPISRIGRVELTRWLREQAISETRHRYGNIKGGKAIPPR